LAAIFEYYDDSWRIQEFRCAVCGWSGRPYEDMRPEGFSELMHFECGACDEILVIVLYPTRELTRGVQAPADDRAAAGLDRAAVERTRRDR
jgi:hypothetical protein